MHRKKNYSHIIWDWNGTLFDDVGWCITVINSMLAKRGIKTLDRITDYQQAFCFPIIQYYKNVGFDFENEAFEDVAKEFISNYHTEKSGNCHLYKNAESVLKAVKEKQITQIILSASEAKNLVSQISEFNINSYFDEILGLSDIYARSKIDVGLDYMQRKKVEYTLLIGDTEHDFEVAKALGADCLLIANGHQDMQRLSLCKVPVLNDISCVAKYLKE